MPDLVLSNVVSDLGGAFSQANRYLREGALTPADVVDVVAASDQEFVYGFTIAGQPGNTGLSTGTFVASFRGQADTPATNCQVSVNLCRINAAGTIQTQTGFSTAQTLTQSRATYNFSFVNPALGTWSVGDRLRVEYKLRNNELAGRTFRTELEGGTKITVPWASVSFPTATYTYRGLAPDMGAVEIVPVTPLQAYLYGGAAPDMGAVETYPTIPSNITPPVITGTAQVGQTLTTTNGTWSGTPTGYAYQWRRNSANIAGANSQTYLLVAADLDAIITVQVAATNAQGGTTILANNVGPVTGAPVVQVAPVISGTAQVGQTLTTTHGTWAGVPTNYTYQWKRAGVAISSANASAYQLVTADQGTLITVTVTASNAIGSASSTSASVGPVAAVDVPPTQPPSSPNRPALGVQIDFTNDPTLPGRTWTDVSADVRSLTTTQCGRNDELQRSEAGTIQMILNNRAGKYDSANAASPYYPNVRRMRWIRVVANWNNGTYIRWQGLIEVWAVRWPASGTDSFVEVRGADVFKVLNLFSLTGTSYPEQTAYERAEAVLTAVGIPYSVDHDMSDVVAAADFTSGDTALSHLLALEETTNGILSARSDGTILFLSRHWRISHSGTPVATIGELAASGEIAYRDASMESPDDDIWNVWTVTPAGGTPETVTNQTSVNRYFPRPRTRDILAVSQTVALDAASYLATRYGDPPERVSQVELLGMNTPTRWPDILTMQSSDRVTWKRRSSYGTFSRDFYVERITDRVTPASWEVVIDISPVGVGQNAWVLQDAAAGLLGQTTVLTY